METIFIKNMVCDRCIMVVRNEFLKLGIEPLSVTLGEVKIPIPLGDAQKDKLDAQLRSLGFELIDDRKTRLAEQVKSLIIDLIYHNEGCLPATPSDYLSGHMHMDYNHISSLFSKSEGTTIEKYFIAQKTERVKELLEYGELNLNEIADKLNYSSAAHLSAQFKKVTGVTPSEFRKSGAGSRRPLDKV